MFSRNSLVTRVAIGKAIGLVLGIIGYFMLPLFMPDPGWQLQLGILFWYATVGAFIGVFGAFTWHPILHLPMPWWFRAPLIGGWMNFLLALFAWDDLQIMMVYTFGPDGVFVSPFWIVAEGLLVGLLIGYVATKLGGEGKAIMDSERGDTD